MKEDIKRIMQLVRDGKLSPEDAAELIEAFQDAPEDQAATEAAAEPTAEEASVPPKAEGKVVDDSFSKLIGSIEKFGKEVTSSVNWKEVADNVRVGVNKGVESLRHAADEAKRGRGPFGGVFGARVQKTVELPISVPEGKVLRLENTSGNVFIEGGHPVGSIKVDAEFRAYSDEEAQQISDRYTPVLEENDSAIVFRHPEPNTIVADLTVKIPSGVPLVLSLCNGDLVIAGTEASVNIEHTSGDIRVTRAKGVVEIATTSSDVKISECDLSNLRIDTKSGDVILDKTGGNANIRSSSGDITAYEFRGESLSIEAASGDITADFAHPISGTVNLRTVSGDVTLHVPDGSDARVSLSTLRGVAECKLFLEDMSETHTKVTGKSGAGNGLIDASAVSGNVRLGLRDSSV